MTITTEYLETLKVDLMAACEPHWKPEDQRDPDFIYWDSSYHNQQYEAVKDVIGNISIPDAFAMHTCLIEMHNHRDSNEDYALEDEALRAAIHVVGRRLYLQPATSEQDIQVRLGFIVEQEEEGAIPDTVHIETLKQIQQDVKALSAGNI